MSLLQQILADYDSITDTELETLGKTLHAHKPNDNVIGVCRSPDARRLLALSFRYNETSALKWADSFKLFGDARTEAIRLFSELDALGDITRDLGWLEIKRELGPATLEGYTSLTIRQGFEVIGSNSDKNHAPGPDISIQGLMGGALDISSIMKDAIEMAKRSGKFKVPPPEDPKPS